MGCGCLAALLSLISPRLALVVLWIFTSLVGRPFDTFLVPLLGLLFLPWTTLIYVLVFTPGVELTGFEWLLVIFGFILDVSTYGGGGLSRRRRS